MLRRGLTPLPTRIARSALTSVLVFTQVIAYRSHINYLLHSLTHSLTHTCTHTRTHISLPSLHSHSLVNILKSNAPFHPLGPHSTPWVTWRQSGGQVSEHGVTAHPHPLLRLDLTPHSRRRHAQQVQHHVHHGPGTVMVMVVVVVCVCVCVCGVCVRMCTCGYGCVRMVCACSMHACVCIAV